MERLRRTDWLDRILVVWSAIWVPLWLWQDNNGAAAWAGCAAVFMAETALMRRDAEVGAAIREALTSPAAPTVPTVANPASASGARAGATGGESACQFDGGKV